MLLQALCIISMPSVYSNWSYSLEVPNLGQNRWFFEPCDLKIWRMILNKANLRDMIAATGLIVILLKLDSNHWFFSPCDLEIWWMTLENNRASLLCCFKLCATFHSHCWSQTGATVRKRQIWWFLEPCDLEIWQMTLNKANLRDLIAATGLIILLTLDSNNRFFSLCDLEIWWMTR